MGRQAALEPSWAPYSRNLLNRVFWLIPRISAARVLLFLVCSSVSSIKARSAWSMVDPTGMRNSFPPSPEDGAGAAEEAGPLRLPLRRLLEYRRQMFQADGSFACQNSGALNHIAQFADVAGPGMGAQDLQDLRRRVGDLDRMLAVHIGEQRGHQRRDVLQRSRSGGSGTGKTFRR